MNACESILGLNPYQGGKPIEELERELGITNITKLASNENPLGVSLKVIEAIESSLSGINRYPDGNAFELKKAISDHLMVASEMIGVLKELCVEKGVEYSTYSASEIKKFATGKGNANKQAMVDSAIALGYAPQDDNEADAIHLYRLASEELKIH